MSRFYDGKTYRDHTPDENECIEREAKRQAVRERHRPLTEQEVLSMFLRQNIQTVAVDDTTAVRMTDFYPEWEDLIGKTVERKDFKFQHNGKLYAVNQPSHTFVKHYEPGPGMESLYREIPEWFAGTEEDPIPYSGNMALESGKYYTEDGVMYKCIRDSLIAVFDPLSELQKVEKGGYVIRA